MIIEVENLLKKYNDKIAVNDISFSVEKGEIFCITGPSGSGKTSAIECIEGLRPLTSGNINVLGLDPFRDRNKMYEKIGVQLQEHTFASEAKVNDLCKLYSSFYNNPYPYTELLKEFDLLDYLGTNAVDLPPGQKKKLSFILALLPNPEIVFLDEITTFLDPGSNKDMLKYILNLKEKGITVLMVSHHIDEVETLSDRVCIMKDGNILTIDNKKSIIKSRDLLEEISLSFNHEDINYFNFNDINGVTDYSIKKNKLLLKGKGGNLLKNIIEFLNKNSIDYYNVNIKKPSLEDAYLDILNYKNYNFTKEV